MRLSVLIAARNSGSFLRPLLERLSAQDVTEVVVVDMGSHDDTVAVARGFGADVSRSAGENYAKSLNAGVRLTSRDALLFLPANAEIPIDLADQVLEALESDESALGVIFQVRSGKTLFRSILQWFGSGFSNEQPCAFAVRREVFLRLGGFSDTDERPISSFMRRLHAEGKVRPIRTMVVLAHSKDA